MRSIALAAFAAFAAGAAAQAQTELRIAHWVPATHPIQTMGLEPWAQAITEASDGRITFAFFPAQQLGAAPDHYDMARDGIADIAFVQPGYTAGRFPIYSLVEIPFHMNDAVRGAQALHEWYLPHAETEMADVKLCVMNPHDPGTIHSKAPIRVPADVRGLNVRPANGTMARFVSLLGGGPVQVSAPEAREAIAKGAADAITFPWNSIYIFGIDSETKHHLDMPFYVSGQVVVMNRRTYDGLSEEDRAVIDAHCTPEWSAKFSEGWAENEAGGRDKMVASDEHELYAPTPEEIEAWRVASAPLIDAWKMDAAAKGVDADEVYDAYVRSLEAHDARY